MCTALPLASFLVFGGGDAYLQDYWGGYWAAVVVPIVLACVPLVGYALPELRKPQPLTRS